MWGMWMKNKTKWDWIVLIQKKKKNEFVNMWLVKKHCKKQPKIITHLHHQKIFFLLVCMYKMVDISAETWNKAGVSVMRILENDNVNKTVLLLLCISDIGKRWGGSSK